MATTMIPVICKFCLSLMRLSSVRPSGDEDGGDHSVVFRCDECGGVNEYVVDLAAARVVDLG